MGKLERISELLSLFQSYRYPVRLIDVAQRLECSTPTVKRYIRTLRSEYHCPIRFDFNTQGYFLDKKNQDTIHVPWLWFNVSELNALLTIHDLIDKLNPGLLQAQLAPLRRRIEQDLALRGVKVGELARRFTFLSMGMRICCPNTFQIVATAAMEHRRISLHYHSRVVDRTSQREVSPQRLISYRGNWYLAAYCHTRQALRILALERMSVIAFVEGNWLEMNDEEIDCACHDSFGIFVGQAEHEAVLRFTRESARWVAEEQWHPRQQGKWLDNGIFELRLPYADPRELVMEILRHGSGVRVDGPPELQLAVRDGLVSALALYENK